MINNKVTEFIEKTGTYVQRKIEQMMELLSLFGILVQYRTLVKDTNGEESEPFLKKDLLLLKEIL